MSFEFGEFPYPGPRVLSEWVGEAVKREFHNRATTDEILAAVREVLDNHENRHGARPVKEVKSSHPKGNPNRLARIMPRSRRLSNS